jgi:hypothetical protein
MQVDCFAATYQAAHELADKARKELDDFTGLVTGMNATVELIEVEAERDLPAAPTEGRITPTFGVSLDARYLMNETT